MIIHIREDITGLQPSLKAFLGVLQKQDYSQNKRNREHWYKT